MINTNLLVYLILLLKTNPIQGHSWLDCVDLRGKECKGFVRGYVGHIDDPMTYRIELRNNEQAVCHPNTQTSPDSYSNQYPRSKAMPGQKLIFSYLENGHVTKDRLPPNGKPNPKTYTIHWSGKPFTGNTNDDSQIKIRGELNSGNQLGDEHNFDDGQCAEDNTMGREGPKPCLGELIVPPNTAPGVYQFIWWWKFDKDPKAGGEEYTSCFDVEVMSSFKYNVTTSMPNYNSNNNRPNNAANNNVANNNAGNNNITNGNATNNDVNNNVNNESNNEDDDNDEEDSRRRVKYIPSSDYSAKAYAYIKPTSIKFDSHNSDNTTTKYSKHFNNNRSRPIIYNGESIKNYEAIEEK